MKTRKPQKFAVINDNWSVDLLCHQKSKNYVKRRKRINKQKKLKNLIKIERSKGTGAGRIIRQFKNKQRKINKNC
jgi:hypothetical protein